MSDVSSQPLQLAPEPEPGAGSDDLALAAERARLQGLIAAARRRTAISKMRAATLEAALREALRAEIESVRVVLATMQRDHERAVAELHEAAADDAARIVSEARRRVLHATGAAARATGDARVRSRVD